jgi:Flp pilus assembly protein TadD
MRFADRLRRCSLLGVLCAAISGCASVGGPKPAAAPQAAAAAAPQSAAAAAPPAAAPASAQTAAVATARAKETPSGISPDVQRTFEYALDALNAGHTDEAAKVFRALTRTNADLGGPHANLGIIYRQAGKPAEAVAELEQAVRLNPQQPVFLNQRGIS